MGTLLSNRIVPPCWPFWPRSAALDCQSGGDDNRDGGGEKDDAFFLRSSLSVLLSRFLP